MTVTLRDESQRAFTVGDRVVCGRNDRRLGVHNALSGTVTAIDAGDDRNTVTFIGKEGGTYTVPRSYLEDGDLDHGYATSIHKAQGSTVDVCSLLGDDRLYRQAGYTALSRGRDANHLYLIGVDERDQFPELELERHGILDADDPFDRIVRSFHRDGSKPLATVIAGEHRHDEPPKGMTLADLWNEWDRIAGQRRRCARRHAQRTRLRLSTGPPEGPGAKDRVANASGGPCRRTRSTSASHRT